ncbi:CBS domain-containing protein [Cellulomonas sp. JZ18]|uniref:CBS domain-containing protein n=1 Tax=Cellulomonas sp. JZ18 TaxID=2654191 RepID=UPI0012D46843|nr:CBS domain-containing protein [Cellulomonas sp. JZ18]QGQ19456.1 CBS domain-containing protein [Cellulomonas sp. JZ18]
MPRTVSEVVDRDVVTAEVTTTVREVAELMRERAVGDVVVTDGGRLVGIVTDRDLVTRVLAVGGTGGDPVGQVCTPDPVHVGPGTTLEQAAALMADNAVRRLPVVDGEVVLGVVSLGDVAVARDAGETLGDISAAPST